MVLTLFCNCYVEASNKCVVLLRTSVNPMCNNGILLLLTTWNKQDVSICPFPFRWANFYIIMMFYCQCLSIEFTTIQKCKQNLISFLWLQHDGPLSVGMRVESARMLWCYTGVCRSIIGACRSMSEMWGWWHDTLSTLVIGILRRHTLASHRYDSDLKSLHWSLRDNRVSDNGRNLWKFLWTVNLIGWVKCLKWETVFISLSCCSKINPLSNQRLFCWKHWTCGWFVNIVDNKINSNFCICEKFSCQSIMNISDL